MTLGRIPGLRHLPEPLLALVLIFAVMSACWPLAKVQPFTAFDQPFYLGIAYDIGHYGRFTSGYFFDRDLPDAKRPSAMRFTPLYPTLLAGLAALDPPFSRAMRCLVHSRGKDPACPRDAFLPRLLQFLMLGLVYFLIWRIARRVSNARRTGWIALVLALITAPELLGYVNYMMTEITALALATAATAASVRGLAESRGAWWLALGGALAGLAALTRPAFFYVFLVCAVAGLVIAACHRMRAAGVRRALAFALAGAVVIAPWIIRNAVVLRDARLTAGYGPEVLVQRVAFDEMSWAEYRLSFLCWLPDGNGMGSLLFGEGACHRFQWSDRPDNFYAIGNGPLKDEVVAAAGGWPHVLPYLLHNEILPHFFKFSMVTISLALRGAWIHRYWGLILAPICFLFTWRAIRRGDALFLAASLPAWFLLLFSAAVSVNQTRYNLLLISPFALSGALAIEALLRRRIAPRAAAESAETDSTSENRSFILQRRTD
ncbi:MAG TPA: glycosyltransferase family 39 protein [Acetobacteraceae bacterium]|nr:glycosyltransferase family 39 protein [Acetobacteraceae bacterium]